MLANLPAITITRGNTERYVLTGDRPGPHREDVLADSALFDIFASVAGSFAWTRGALAATGWLDWLAVLPLETRIELPDGTRVLGVHAAPGRDDGDGITPHRPDHELVEAFEGVAAEIVVAGHTHQPTDRLVGSVRALNGGCVSNPITDELRPCYLIIHADEDSHKVEHRRVAYDRDSFLRRLGASGHPEHEYIASFQTGGQFRFPARRPGAPVTID